LVFIEFRPLVEAMVSFLIDLKERLAKSDFGKKIAQTFVTQCCLLGIGFLSSILISRNLGPTFRGMYAVAMAIGAIGVQFGNMGIHSANTYFVARDPKLLPAIVGNALVTSLGLGSLCSIAVLIFCILKPDVASIEGVLLFLSILWIPLGLTLMLFQNILLGIHEVKSFNQSELINRVLNFVVVGLLFFIGLKNVPLIFSVNIFALLVALFFVFHKIRGRMQKKPYFSPVLLKESFSFALKIYAACFLVFLVTRCDVLVAKYFLGFEQAGYYAVAIGSMEILGMFPAIVGMLLFPKLSAMNEGLEKLRYLKKYGVLVFFSMALIALVLFVLAKPFIQVVYGVEFLPVIPIFIALLPGMICLSVHGICNNYLCATGAPIIIIFSPLLTLMGKLLLWIKIVPLLGIVGISVCYSSGHLLMLTITLSYLYFKKRRFSSSAPQNAGG